MDICGPSDADHDDEDPEKFDPASDYTDGVVAQRFEPVEGDHIVHFGVSRKRVARFTSGSRVSLPKPDIPPIGYFAFTLEVMEVITLDAILN